MADDRTELIKAVAVTAELLGTQMSDTAAKVMVDDLSVYPQQQVFAALKRCRREVKGRLTLADVITRLDDGRPGPEEAWAMLPKADYHAVVWSEEMRTAYGVASPLLDAGDEIAARMAFKEAYAAEVTKARAEQRPPRWMLSRCPAIHGEGANRVAVEKAVEKGRITEEEAKRMLPEYERQDVKQLPGRTGDQSQVMEHLELMRELVGEDSTV